MRLDGTITVHDQIPGAGMRTRVRGNLPIGGNNNTELMIVLCVGDVANDLILLEHGLATTAACCLLHFSP